MAKKSKTATLSEVAIVLQKAIISSELSEVRELAMVMDEYENNNDYLLKNLRHPGFETLWNALVDGINERDRISQIRG